MRNNLKALTYQMQYNNHIHITAKVFTLPWRTNTMEEINHYDSDANRFQRNIVVGLFCADVLGYFASAFPHTRSQPPELWNYFDHAGNVMCIGYGYMAAGMRGVRSRMPERPIRRMLAGGAIGLVVGLSINACFETKIGDELVGQHVAALGDVKSSADVGDLAWGTAASIIGGSLVAARRRPKNQRHHS